MITENIECQRERMTRPGTKVLVISFCVSLFLKSVAGIVASPKDENSLFFYLTIFSAGGIQCHYCGVKDLCELPYDPAEANYITCPKSCLKFDG